MGKKEKQFPVYEGAIEFLTTQRKIIVIICCIFSVLFLGVPAISLGINEESIVFVIIAALITVIVAAVTIRYYKKIPKDIESMKQTIGITSDEEMEYLLSGSEKLYQYIFFSDEYLLDFNHCKSYAYKDMKVINPFEYQQKRNTGYHTIYGINFEMKNGKKMTLYFPDAAMRDRVAKCVKDAC